MILTDLGDFVPRDYFENNVEKLKLSEEIKNAAHFNRELKWGHLAATLGMKLISDPPATMTARQVSATDVLWNLGMLAATEVQQTVLKQLSKDATEKEISDGNAGERANQLENEHLPTLLDNVRGALEQYFHCLTPFEKEPFLSLFNLTSTSQIRGIPAMTTININGNVASLQTGDNAVANVVQNFGSYERESLVTALQRIKEAIEVASSLTESKRQELLSIEQECSSQIYRESPNFDKFMVLGTAIQSIASAQPAYLALKAAVLPLGINLP